MCCVNSPYKKLMPARALAWKCLDRWSQGGVFAEALVDSESRYHELSSADRALLQAIVFGTLRNKTYLEHLCKQLRDAPLEDSLRNLVMSALFQLLMMGQAEYAVVNETVKIAPTRAAGLVNAMLRQALRMKDEFIRTRDELPLDVSYSTPNWLVQRWVKDFGDKECRAMLEWNLKTPSLYARINPLNPLSPIPEAWTALEGENLEGWYAVQGGLPMEALKAGQVYMADPSTRFAVHMMQVVPGERVLDACAAPGGKSMALLGMTGGDIQLLASDMHDHRLYSLEQNLLRAGAKNVELAAHDWSRPCPPAWREAFDAILLDVPCSNSGVLQRRVDARWRLNTLEMKRISALQLSIMHQASKALRPGGRMVYSTCSIDRQENENNVERFLYAHPDFVLEESFLALPHQEKTDGAFAARLRRVKNDAN